MKLVVVDVETDGPMPPDYSIVCFGAVIVEDGLFRSFYGRVRPISDKYIPEAISVSGVTREEHLKFDDPVKVMANFNTWLLENAGGRPIFITDNLAFDWQFINYYFHKFLGSNPFGYSGRRIGDLYSGMMKDMSKGSKWKGLRKTKHTHNPVDDARGNAEALLEFRKMGLRF